MTAATEYMCTGCSRPLDNCTCTHPPGFYNLDPVITAIHSYNGDDTPKPELEDDDWARHDLTDIATQMRAGDYQPTLPTILPVEAATPLFYPARINGIFGESTAGKTWIAQCAAQGLRCLWIDYEDGPALFTERAITLGYTDHQIDLIDYRNPTSGLGAGLEHLAAHEPNPDPYQLVVIDSAGEALAAGGVKGEDDEVTTWFRHKVKPYLALPGAPAILLLDHIPKDPNSPKLYAFGPQRKRAAITGASYRLDCITPFARDKDGKVKLTVAKDRLGNRPMGTTAAIADITTGPNTITFRFHLSDAQLAHEAGQPWRPTIYMERVSRWLENHPGASQKAIVDGCEGKKDVLYLAIETLDTEGWIEVTAGPRGALLHTVTRPYREDNEVVDNSTSPPPPTSPHLPPGEVPPPPHLPPTPYRGEVRRGEVNPHSEIDLPPVDNSQKPPDYNPELWPDGTPAF